MNKDELTDRYFDWIYQLVVDQDSDNAYYKLFRRLFSKEFIYTIPMDGNRAEDGINLRYRFGYEQGYSSAAIDCLLDDRPCSILEMLVALALRCEEQIMRNPEKGDRTKIWFWTMLDSLGLSYMDDAEYNRVYVDRVLKRFTNHTYKRNGEGSLFIVNDPRIDMRSTELWYQMNYYLNEFIKNGGL